jgi:hypothetical protein
MSYPVKHRDRAWQLYRPGGGRLVHANKRRWYVGSRQPFTEVAEAQCGNSHFDPNWINELDVMNADRPTCENCLWRWERHGRGGDAMPSVNELMNHAERLRARAEAAENQAFGLLELGEDDFEDGDVLWFKKRFAEYPDAKEYTYAALKAAGFWYLTGRTMQRMHWSALVNFLSEGVDELWQCTEFEPIW